MELIFFVCQMFQITALILHTELVCRTIPLSMEQSMKLLYKEVTTPMFLVRSVMYWLDHLISWSQLWPAVQLPGQGSTLAIYCQDIGVISGFHLYAWMNPWRLYLTVGLITMALYFTTLKQPVVLASHAQVLRTTTTKNWTVLCAPSSLHINKELNWIVCTK